jgi:hypothetical protein
MISWAFVLDSILPLLVVVHSVLQLPLVLGFRDLFLHLESPCFPPEWPKKNVPNTGKKLLDHHNMSRARRRKLRMPIWGKPKQSAKGICPKADLEISAASSAWAKDTKSGSS